MGTTPILALPYQELSDPPHGPNLGKNLADRVEGVRALFVCTSTTRPATPHQGMTIYETDTTHVLFWDGAAWKAIRVNEPAQASDSTDLLGFTNSGYAFGTPTVGATFNAPPSGRAEVSVYMAYRMNTANSFFGTFEVRAGTGTAGTLVYGPNDEDALRVSTAIGVLATSTGPHLVTGLTSGSVYTAWTKHRVAGGNGDIFDRKIFAKPVL